MSELYNAIMAWEDSDKSYEAEPLKEGADNFKNIQDMIQGGTKLSDEEKQAIQKKVYEWDEMTNKASEEGNQAAATVNQKVCSNLEFALQYYEKYNPN